MLGFYGVVGYHIKPQDLVQDDPFTWPSLGWLLEHPIWPGTSIMAKQTSSQFAYGDFPGNVNIGGYRMGPPR